MVKVIAHEQRINSNQEPFSVLILEGDLETVTSQSGGVFFTARKTSVPCSFSPEKAESMIGKELPGKILRIPCEPYEYTNKEGEVLILSHTYEYDPNAGQTMEEAVFTDEAEFVS